MMSDIRYILKRIVIGVGIAFVLSFLRGNLLISARALEPTNVSPNGMCWFSNNVAPDGCYLTPNQFNISWTTFYGNQFGADGSVERFFWRYYKPNIGGKYYNIDFLFYNGDKSSYLESNRGYIQNSQNNTFSCRIDNTRWGVTDSTSSNAPAIGTATVHCDNVYLSDDYFTFHFVDGTKSYQSVYAVTEATLTPTSEQSVIDNQNENTEKQIESQSVCKNLSINDATLDGFLRPDGNFYSQTGFNKTTPFITLNGINKIILLKKATTNKYLCFYDSSQVNINCIDTSTLSNNSVITIPSNASYFRVNFEVSNSLPVFSVCQNGNQAIAESQKELNNTINDTNVSSATSDGSGFFGNFQSNAHGLSGIITAPLRLLNTFTTATCSPLEFDLPFVHNHVSLPCMREIYEQHFGIFFSLWQLITTGLISYNICINLYGKVRNLQNPNNDRIEVLNL